MFNLNFNVEEEHKEYTDQEKEIILELIKSLNHGAFLKDKSYYDLSKQIVITSINEFDEFKQRTGA